MLEALKVRLRDILKVDLLAGAEVIAGVAGMDNEIASVNVMEVPDIVDWVRPGELLLTTAFSLSDNVEAFNTLLPMLSEKGVCGMGIKMKRYITELPESVIETANKLGFPIISIPPDVSYGDLMKQIFTYIIGEQTRLLTKINNINNQIRDIMLRSGDMEEFAELISKVVQSPTMISDQVHKSFVFHTEDKAWEAILGRVVPATINNTSIPVDPELSEIHTSYDQVDGEKVKRFSIPIYFEENLYGYINIWDVHDRINKGDLFVIVSTTSLIALHIVNKLNVTQRENVHRTNFLELLLSNKPESQARAIFDAEYYGFNPTGHHQCLILRLDYQDSILSASLRTRRIQETSLILTGILSYVERKASSRYICATKSNECYFLLEFDQNLSSESRAAQTKQFVYSLLEVARDLKVEEQSFIGVGRAYPGYDKLSESLHEAQQTVRILQSSQRDVKEHYGFFEEMGIARLFGSPEIRKDLLSYADQVLQPILHYDAEHDGKLLETVQAYFEHGGNLRKTSEVQYTHQNTVVYRINRIRDYLKIDLKDPETAFAIQFALKIRDLIG
ncbi:MAG TPA: PucR family transcriptional regulator ligand-binding domain-containing protein [Anaerolineaceae bacterium]|nr:PucR family transcriptional regulator ligand-binding domain-containing protein [Anaerolineaceae bacterium]